MRVLLCRDGYLASDRSPLIYGTDSGSVAANTTDSVYVCSFHLRCVGVVSVSEDGIFEQLDKPAEVLSIACDVKKTILVCYCENTLVIYRRDSHTTCQVLQIP